MASTYLTRTPSSNGNQKTWTFSAWIKNNGKSGDSTYQYLMEAYYSNGTRYSYVCLRHGTIETYGGDYQTGSSTSLSFDVTTNRLLRDPSAWYHVVVAFDSTQSTNTDRVKIYINGVQETSFQGYVGGGSLTWPDQNDDTFFNVTTTLNRIGKEFDGSMSHIHFVDGTAYAPTAFGETDSTTGEWKIKTDVSVTYGTNGFFILKDGNSVTDQSGNSNNFTVAAGTLTNTEDCPSNVFATGNPIHVDGTSASAFINGNLTHTNNVGAVSSLAINKGKWYMEFKRQDNGGSITNWMYCGFAKADRTGLRLYRSSNGDYYNGSSYSSYGASWSDGDIVGVALDYDNDTIEFYKNGTSQGSKTSIGICDGDYVLPIWQCSQSSGSPYFHANFGNGYFGTTQISSEGTNASGIGKFEYDVPTGYTALSTKGLNE